MTQLITLFGLKVKWTAYAVNSMDFLQPALHQVLEPGRQNGLSCLETRNVYTLLKTMMKLEEMLRRNFVKNFTE